MPVKFLESRKASGKEIDVGPQAGHHDPYLIERR
jgi:hypothetical protein